MVNMQSLDMPCRAPGGILQPHFPAHSADSLETGTAAVLAHADTQFLREAERLADRIGVDLAVAKTAKDAHRLAMLAEPAVVILDVQLADESGYLACAKIKTQYPHCRVILLANGRTPEIVRYANFAGAEAVYHRNMQPETLIDLVLAMTVQTV